MQRILSYTIFCALLFSVVACKKFLGKNPDNRASVSTPEQVSQLLGTAYPQANYADFAESMSDNVADKGVGVQDKVNIDSYFFNDVTALDQDSPEYYWDACYTAIAAANQALAAIKSASDTSAYKAQKGEALVCRAYAHFMLVTLFSKVYNSSTAGSDMGIPYVTEPENVVFKQYDRKTVAYDYQMIEQDLTQGLPLIDDTKYTIPRYHFTKAAAHAFAARFYLFKKDYAQVVSHANAVFAAANVASVLRPWNTTYLTYTLADMFAVYAKATEPANLLLVETSSVWARNFYSVRYGLTSAKRDEIFANNPTLGQWAFRNQTYIIGSNDLLIPKINEYFVRSSVNANIGYPYVMVPLFTTEEVLFNRAEAYTYLKNNTAALADLNTYAGTRIKNYNASGNTLDVHRIDSFYSTSNTTQALINTIMNFKRCEYVQEGMRWFDLLRYNDPVTHYSSTGTAVLTANDPRRVLQLPESVKTSGMPLNPR